MVGLLRRLAQAIKAAVLGVQEYSELSFAGVRALFTRPRYPREIVAQMDSLGWARSRSWS